MKQEDFETQTPVATLSRVDGDKWAERAGTRVHPTIRLILELCEHERLDRVLAIRLSHNYSHVCTRPRKVHVYVDGQALKFPEDLWKRVIAWHCSARMRLLDLRIPYPSECPMFFFEMSDDERKGRAMIITSDHVLSIMKEALHIEA